MGSSARCSGQRALLSNVRKFIKKRRKYAGVLFCGSGCVQCSGSNAETFEAGRVEQLFRVEQTTGQAFFVVTLQEAVDRVFVRRETV